MADELKQQITDDAAKAKMTNIDGEIVQRRDLQELIKADQHLAGNEAIKSRRRGLRFNKLVPPGTV